MADLWERFLNRIQKDGPVQPHRPDLGACWTWLGWRGNHGYGVITQGPKGHQKQLLAHRVAWLTFFGEIPAGMCVCHHCDNRSCVNPAHLFLGDRTANNRDMISKGRGAPASVKLRNAVPFKRGEAHPAAKLTAEQVREIRAKYGAGGESRYTLATAYGVSSTTIQHVLRRTTWQHV